MPAVSGPCIPGELSADRLRSTGTARLAQAEPVAPAAEMRAHAGEPARAIAYSPGASDQGLRHTAKALPVLHVT